MGHMKQELKLSCYHLYASKKKNAFVLSEQILQSQLTQHKPHCVLHMFFSL